MTERLRRVELAIDMPGPKGLDEPLDSVEKVFLQKKVGPNLVLQIEQGLLWQDN